MRFNTNLKWKMNQLLSYHQMKEQKLQNDAKKKMLIINEQQC